jgi:hypothetical protein
VSVIQLFSFSLAAFLLCYAIWCLLGPPKAKPRSIVTAIVALVLVAIFLVFSLFLGIPTFGG